jgi:hypothetical protein
MTILELGRVLVELGVNSDAYCLTGGLPNEAYTIEPSAGRWLVYYSERGCRRGLQEFASESDACHELLDRVLGGLKTSLPSVKERDT